METITFTLALVFRFFSSLNPVKALENVVENAKTMLSNAQKELETAEKKNDLKAYKGAFERVTTSKSALETAEKAVKDAEKPKRNDLIQLAIFACVLLKVNYTQKEIIDLGATTCGQFGYTKRIVYWLAFFGYTLNCEKLKKDIIEFAQKENEKKAKNN